MPHPSPSKSKADKPQATVKSRIKKAAKFGAWTSAAIGAAAIYNHIDAGIVAAEADQSAELFSKSGKISIKYRHISRELAQAIAPLPDQIESDLQRLPIAREQCRALLSSPLHIQVLAPTDWNDAQSELMRVSSDGTIQLNAARLNFVVTWPVDPSEPSKAASGSAVIAHRVTANLVEWASWRSIAADLKAAHAPLRLLASSELQSAIGVTSDGAAELLARGDGELENSTAQSLKFRSDIPSDPSLSYHSISYGLLKRHLEATYGLSSIDSMLRSPQRKLNFAQELRLSKFADYFSQKALASELSVTDPLSISMLISKRRERAIADASRTAALVARERLMELQGRKPALLVAQPDNVAQIGQISITDTGTLRSISQELVRLFAPFEEAKQTNPPKAMLDLTQGLVHCLNTRFNAARDGLPQTWECRDALAAVVLLKPLVTKYFDAANGGALINKLNATSMRALEICSARIPDNFVDNVLDSQDVTAAVIYAHELLAIDRDNAQLKSAIEQLTNVSESIPKIKIEDPGVIAVSSSIVAMLRRELSPPEVTAVLNLCQAKIYVARESGPHGSDRTVNPAQLTEFLASDWLSEIPHSCRTAILKELANYADGVHLDSIPLVLAASSVHYDPAERIEDMLTLQKVSETLLPLQRDASVEALLSLPQLLRSKILTRLDAVRQNQIAGDSASVDSNEENFGYFARVGVLTTALRRIIDSDETFKHFEAFDLVNTITKGAAQRTSWATNVDVYASSSATQLSWGSLIADGEYSAFFRSEIDKRLPLRQAFPQVVAHMQDFELRVSRGVGWVTNKVEAIIDHGESRPATTGIFRQNPRSGLGSVTQPTIPQVGAILVGKQYTSDFNSFYRGALRWEDTLRSAYGTEINVHTVNSPEEVKAILKDVTERAIKVGKTDEFILVINAHGGASAVDAGGINLLSEGSRYRSWSWLGEKNLEEGQLKALINRYVTPYFKRVSIIFDSCHSGGWTE